MSAIKSYYGGAYRDGAQSHLKSGILPLVKSSAGELPQQKCLMMPLLPLPQKPKIMGHLFVQERGQILIKCAHALRDANAELSALEVQDVGKVYTEALTADVPSALMLEYMGAAIMTHHGTQHHNGQGRLVIHGACRLGSVPGLCA